MTDPFDSETCVLLLRRPSWQKGCVREEWLFPVDFCTMGHISGRGGECSGASSSFSGRSADAPASPPFHPDACLPNSTHAMTAASYVQLELGVDPELVDRLIALLAELGFEGFWEDGAILRCFMSERRWSDRLRQEIERAIRLLVPAGTYPFPEFRIQRIADQNWNEQWERSIQPIHLTPEIIVAPTWQPCQPEPGSLVLRIDPKMAFGTGYHESTRLAARLLQHHFVPSERVLDVGTGTGILAILAAKLGASHVVAIDIDEWSYLNANENARLNACVDRITILQGGLEVVPAGRFDLILANIQLTVIAGLLAQFRERLQAGGTLVLSGLLTTESDEIAGLLRDAGLRVLEECTENDWIALASTPSSL
jgi:ribosomal protein L11 methyltransferase